MLVPLVLARMKEQRDLAGIGIDARQVGAFVKIALMARPCKIRQIVRSAMLSGNNVFYLERVIGIMLLTKTAVLAPIFRALPNRLSPWKVNPQAAAFFK
jgi:hypothetical protein